MSNVQPFVNIQDVAARAGVSAMTVSRVINRHAGVSQATRQRVEQAIEELGYVPNALARGVFGRRTRTIALLVSDIGNPFYTMIARGVEDTARRGGYTVFLCNSDDAEEKEQAYVNAMLSNRIDGLVVASGSGSLKTLRLLSKRGVPFVLIDRAAEGMNADAVVGDSVGGARTLTRHLLELGHRRIALVGGSPDILSARERRLGYEEALGERGVTPDPRLILEGAYTRDSGYRSAKRLLALPVGARPTAIFAGSNFLAVGVLQALREAELKVPQDVALVCFDDIELAAAVYPFLTVMAQPAATFGSIAAQFLLERLESETPLPARKVVLPPEFIVRLSCGAKLP